MFIGDKPKKTVRLKVRVKAGSIVRPDGTPLPKIQDGTLAELVLPAGQLVDEAERRGLVLPSLDNAKVNAKALLTNIVAELRSIPDKVSGNDSPLDDPWEEIKAQVQGELSVEWLAYLETIKQVIGGEVGKLSPTELLSLSSDLKVSAGNSSDIRQALLRRLLAKARKEKIRYKPLDFDYFWYSFSGMPIYTHILKRTGTDTCWVLAYSGAAPFGEHGEIDLAAIDNTTDIHIMTADDFEKARSLNWPDQMNDLSAPTREVTSILSATEALSRVQLLSNAEAQWDSILLQLNPSADPEVEHLLIKIRGPHLLVPRVGLRVIEDGCNRALALSPTADFLAALREAIRGQLPFVRD